MCIRRSHHQVLFPINRVHILSTCINVHQPRSTRIDRLFTGDEPLVSCSCGCLGCGKNGLEFCCGYGLVVIEVMLALHSKCVLYQSCKTAQTGVSVINACYSWAHLFGGTFRGAAGRHRWVTKALALQRPLIVASQLSLPTDQAVGTSHHDGGSGSRSPRHVTCPEPDQPQNDPPCRCSI